jgi:DNA-binding Lrp family transcriptional regulator
MLRIKVLRGRLDALTTALAARDDIPFIDVSAGGDEISAIAATDVGARNRLVFEQLPATTAVTAVTAQSVLHVFSDAADWRLDVLTPAERSALSVANPEPLTRPDDVDQQILAALADDARASAAAVATATGLPDSTVRRRLAALAEHGHLRTQVVVDPGRLGLTVDANLWLQVPPGQLEPIGLALAAHPAVHGTLATTGPAPLHLAVWLRDLDALYRFVANDLGALGVQVLDIVLVGRAVKRPGARTRIR